MACSRRKNLLNIFGMCCGAFAEMLNATEDSIAKASGLSASQLIFGRYIFQLVICVMLWIKLQNNNSAQSLGHWYGNPPQTRKIWAYGALQFIVVSCIWYGIRSVPIGISYCILASGDALTLYISYKYFKEPLFKMFPISVFLRIVSLLLLLQKPHFVFEYVFHDTKIHTSEVQVSGLILVGIAAIAYSISNVMLKSTADTEEGAHWL
eukprot:898402_1